MFFFLCRRAIGILAGIIPALETSHAVAYGVKLAAKLPKEQVVIINLSGRGDKDVCSAARAMGTEIKL